MKYNRVLVWFRNDLRVRDNEVLVKAALSAKEVIPVYCFDPRTFENTNLGFPKTGSFRAGFLIESVADLRKSLRENRYFNILLPAKNYDKNRDYIRIWIPELQAIKGFYIHQPWELSTAIKRGLKIQLGHTYPQPLRKISTLERSYCLVQVQVKITLSPVFILHPGEILGNSPEFLPDP